MRETGAVYPDACISLPKQQGAVVTFLSKPLVSVVSSVRDHTVGEPNVRKRDLESSELRNNLCRVYLYVYVIKGGLVDALACECGGDGLEPV